MEIKLQQKGSFTSHVDRCDFVDKLTLDNYIDACFGHWSELDNSQNDCTGQCGAVFCFFFFVFCLFAFIFSRLHRWVVLQRYPCFNFHITGG